MRDSAVAGGARDLTVRPAGSGPWPATGQDVDDGQQPGAAARNSAPYRTVSRSFEQHLEYRELLGAELQALPSPGGLPAGWVQSQVTVDQNRGQRGAGAAGQRPDRSESTRLNSSHP